jgi:transposase InsO family protein
VRQIILLMVSRFAEQAGYLPQTLADQYFCTMHKNGVLRLSDWMYEHIKGFTPRTLARWRSDIKEGKLADAGRPKGSTILDRAENGEVRTLVLDVMTKYTHAKAPHILALVNSRYPNGIDIIDEDTGECTTVPVPSLKSFQRAIKSWKVTYHNVLTKITDPDTYRSHIRVAASGSTKADHLNELWEIDASPTDVMLLVDGKAVRHNLYMAVDVYSRRAVILVTRTPRAEGVALLIRKCLLRWGVPTTIKTDNGSDFIAKDTKRLLDALGIEVELCPPYTPEAKGIVERAIGTFQRDLPPLCPGFIGHNVADRKQIEGRKSFGQRLGADDVDLFDVELSLAEFQTWCDDWAYKIYETRAHGGLGKKSPFEKATAYQGVVRHIEDEAALNVLLAKPAKGGGIRRVRKVGVDVDNVRYMSLGPQPGEDVLVRMDPHDAGRIMMFDPETGAFLGEGLNAELLGISPAEVAAKSKAIQKSREGEQFKEIRAVSKPVDKMEIAHAIRAEAEAKQDKLLAFPQRVQAHSTPELDGAAQAAGTAKRKEPQATPIDEAERVAFLEEFREKAKPQRHVVETDRDRFERARGLEAEIKDGLQINEACFDWLKKYQTTAEYRVWCDVLEHSPLKVQGKD